MRQARIGGRVLTEDVSGAKVDLGAMLIVGTQGNPLIALAEQAGSRLHTLDRSRCPLYDGETLLEPTIDASAEEKFNQLLELAKPDYGYTTTEKRGDKVKLRFSTTANRTAAFDAIEAATPALLKKPAPLYGIAGLPNGITKAQHRQILTSCGWSKDDWICGAKEGVGAV